MMTANRFLESEDDPPSRWYVRYESKRLINALKKEHGADWRDYIDNHFDIMEVRDFDSFSEAKRFSQKTQRSGFYSELLERQHLEWVADLREWHWEGEVLDAGDVE